MPYYVIEKSTRRVVAIEEQEPPTDAYSPELFEVRYLKRRFDLEIIEATQGGMRIIREADVIPEEPFPEEIAAQEREKARSKIKKLKDKPDLSNAETREILQAVACLVVDD